MSAPTRPSSYQRPRLPLPLIPLVDTKFRENGSQPSPNRACTFPRTRLSILEGVLEAVLFKRTAFACPTFPAWDSRTVSLPLSVQLSIVLPPLILWLIQITLAAKPITGKRWVLWRLRYPTGDWTKPAHQLRQSCVSA